MAATHVVELPKSVLILKIIQLVLSALVLGLCIIASCLYYAFSGPTFAIFTAIASIIILSYYFVAVQKSQKLYNWVAILVLECFALLWWLGTWSGLASLYSLLALINYYDDVDGNFGDTYSNLGKPNAGFTAVLIIAIVASVVQFILFCTTLGFLGSGIHRHRKAGLPMKPADSVEPSGAWTNIDENKMHNYATSAAHPVYPTQPNYSFDAQKIPSPYGQQP